MKILDRILAERPPNAASLVVSAFGDAVVPHGGAIWLGSLIRWLAPFGVNERAVRTAAQRLAADDWFRTRTAGRRADYLLTPAGRHRFADADRRIYADAPHAWDGTWSIVVIPPGGVPTERRDAARRELRWHGFGELAPNVLVHPRADLEELDLALRDLGLDRRSLVLRAHAEREHETPLARIGAAWDLRDLASDYASYVERFRPLAAKLRASAVEPEIAFRIRVLAIHEYRRILLRDPELPAELLPKGWVGDEARSLCEDIYRRVEAAAVEFVLATGETAAGRLPPPRDFYYRRFGGLREDRESRAGARVHTG